MDAQHALADQDFKAELIDRLPELLAHVPSGFEGLEGGLPTALLIDEVDRIAEGTGSSGSDGLEAIILQFGRPVLLIQDSTFAPAPTGLPLSEVVAGRLADARTGLEQAIPSVGRIDVRNHRNEWVGTGWLVKPDVVVTNRHVAEEFAARSPAGFPLRATSANRIAQPSLDLRREYLRPDELVLRLDGVLWIEPDGGPDIAFLRVDPRDIADVPPAIPLMTAEEMTSLVGEWVAVIGYPAHSSYNDLADQQRIFDGIYSVKRLAPGTVMSVSPDGQIRHDATTLGGNSGSVVIHLDSGRAMGLHFGGIERGQNYAVQAPVVSALMAAHT